MKTFVICTRSSTFASLISVDDCGFVVNGLDNNKFKDGYYYLIHVDNTNPNIPIISRIFEFKKTQKCNLFNF